MERQSLEARHSVGNLAPHLPSPTISLRSHLGLAALLLPSDFSSQDCSCMLQLLCTNSQPFSPQNCLHAGTEGLLPIENQPKLSVVQFSKQ